MELTGQENRPTELYTYNIIYLAMVGAFTRCYWFGKKNEGVDKTFDESLH